MSHHPQPTERARELVRNSYDVHVHIAPDVMKRRIDDIGLAARYAQLGLAGFVIKSHYTPTAERAEQVRHPAPAGWTTTRNSRLGTTKWGSRTT